MLIRKKKETIYLLDNKQIKIPFPRLEPEIVGENEKIVIYLQMNMSEYNNTDKLGYSHNLGIISKELKKAKTLYSVSPTLNAVLSEFSRGVGIKSEIDEKYSETLIDLCFNNHEKKELELMVNDFIEYDSELDKKLIEELEKTEEEISNIKNVYSHSVKLENDKNGEILYRTQNLVVNSTGDILYNAPKGKIEDFNDYYFLMKYGLHNFLVDRGTNEVIIGLDEKASIIELFSNNDKFIMKTVNKNRMLMDKDKNILIKDILNHVEIGKYINITKNNKETLYDNNFNLIRKFDDELRLYCEFKDKLIFIDLEGEKRILFYDINEDKFIYEINGISSYFNINSDKYFGYKDQNDEPFILNKENMKTVKVIDFEGEFSRVKEINEDLIYYITIKNKEAYYIYKGEEVESNRIIKMVTGDTERKFSVFDNI